MAMSHPTVNMIHPGNILNFISQNAESKETINELHTYEFIFLVSLVVNCQGHYFCFCMQRGHIYFDNIVSVNIVLS